MLFNTLKFAVFLLLVFVGHRLIERWRLPRTLWLLLASYLFYASWNPWYLLLIVASTVLDYAIGKGLTRSDDARIRRGLLITSIVGNIGLLSVFKYGNFVLENIELAAAMVGVELRLAREKRALLQEFLRLEGEEKKEQTARGVVVVVGGGAGGGNHGRNNDRQHNGGGALTENGKRKQEEMMTS